MWFRASELKHGRVAMLATVGYLTGAAGITFPGEIAKGVSFESVNSGGVFSAWSNVPEAGKLQILSLIFMLELSTESKKPHYMRVSAPMPNAQRPWLTAPPTCCTSGTVPPEGPQHQLQRRTISGSK